jgi:hypothetical protein
MVIVHRNHRIISNFSRGSGGKKMKKWIENFKPCMVIFVQSCPEDETARMVRAVCADRVFRVRYKIAVRNAKGDKKILRWLGMDYK